jgi:hypothetical protein
MNLLPIGYT